MKVEHPSNQPEQGEIIFMKVAFDIVNNRWKPMQN